MATQFIRMVLMVVFSTLVLPNANAQSIVWTQTIGSSGSGVGGGSVDRAGNLYTIGGFGSTIDFDRFGGYNLTAASQRDMFIMKETSSGNLIWVKQVSGLSSGVLGCFGKATGVDDNGNVFVIGLFRDSFDFDPGSAVYKLNSHGSDHAFILKLDSSGNFVWVKDIGTHIPSVNIQATAARRDKDGFLYFSGIVNGDGATAMDIDPGPGVYNITPSLGDLLIEKLDSNGNFVWAKQITGDNTKTPYFLGFDSASNVFVSGTLLGSADFDPGPGVHTLTASPATPPFIRPHDIFVAKYDSSGNFVWAHSIGSGYDDEVSAGAVDRFGNVLLTGSFGSIVDFDPGPGVFNLSALATRSLFTLRLTNDGDFSWAKMGGSSAVSFGRALAADSAGNVYTGAGLFGSCDLDPDTGNFVVSSGVGIQELDSSGHFIWGTSVPGYAPTWIGVPKLDSIIYVTGGKIPSGSTGANFSGFIAKLKQTPLPNGVEAINNIPEVSVAPNPTTGIISVSSPRRINRITLTDIAGRVVYGQEPNKLKTTIDLSGKAAGIYFYELDCGAGKQRGKLELK
ncbi:MAG: T9SS type A sorting domain-containing protein [Bacteroidetes bacterium]|nr:T9SS type A sorting domain-containing protein [Bacteroidota bacterium]